jgi:hypothetical protein
MDLLKVQIGWFAAGAAAMAFVGAAFMWCGR